MIGPMREALRLLLASRGAKPVAKASGPRRQRALTSFQDIAFEDIDCKQRSAVLLSFRLPPKHPGQLKTKKKRENYWDIRGKRTLPRDSFVGFILGEYVYDLCVRVLWLYLRCLYSHKAVSVRAHGQIVSECVLLSLRYHASLNTATPAPFMHVKTIFLYIHDLIAGNEIQYVATVVHRDGIARVDEEGIAHPLVGLNFHADDLADVLVHLGNGVVPDLIMVQAGTNLFTYQPVLKCLQQMDSIPLGEELVLGQLSEPPAYLDHIDIGRELVCYSLKYFPSCLPACPSVFEQCAFS